MFKFSKSFRVLITTALHCTLLINSVSAASESGSNKLVLNKAVNQLAEWHSTKTWTYWNLEAEPFNSTKLDDTVQRFYASVGDGSEVTIAACLWVSGTGHNEIPSAKFHRIQCATTPDTKGQKLLGHFIKTTRPPMMSASAQGSLKWNAEDLACYSLTSSSVDVALLDKARKQSSGAYISAYGKYNAQDKPDFVAPCGYATSDGRSKQNKGCVKLMKSLGFDISFPHKNGNVNGNIEAEAKNSELKTKSSG